MHDCKPVDVPIRFDKAKLFNTKKELEEFLKKENRSFNCHNAGHPFYQPHLPHLGALSVRPYQPSTWQARETPGPAKARPLELRISRTMSRLYKLAGKLMSLAQWALDLGPMDDQNMLMLSNEFIGKLWELMGVSYSIIVADFFPIDSIFHHKTLATSHGYGPACPKHNLSCYTSPSTAPTFLAAFHDACKVEPLTMDTLIVPM